MPRAPIRGREAQKANILSLLPWLLPLRLLLLLRCSSCSSCSCSCPLCCSTCSSWSCSCPSTQHIWDKRTSGCSGDFKNLVALGTTGSLWVRLSSISAETKDSNKFRPSRAGAFFCFRKPLRDPFGRPVWSQAASNSAFGPRLLPGQVVPPLRGGGAS